MTLQLLKTFLPKGPAMVASIGFNTCSCKSGHSPALDLPGPITSVDLDHIDPGSSLPEVDSGVVVLYARSYTDLRRASALGMLLPEATHFIVVVAETSRYRLLGLPSASPEWQPVQRVQVYQHPEKGWALEARFRRKTPPRTFLASTVQSIARNKKLPSPRVALAGSGSVEWRPGDPAAILTTPSGPISQPDEYPPADVVIRTDGTDTEWRDSRVKVIDRPLPAQLTWSQVSGSAHSGDALTQLNEPSAIPPVDEFSVNPMGFVARPGSGIAHLTQSGDHWIIDGGGIKNALHVQSSGTVTDSDIEALRQLRGVFIDWGRHTGPVAALRSVISLAAAGVPVFSQHVPAWADALGGELANRLTAVVAADLDDDLHREEHSIRLRRAALRTHSVEARWRQLAQDVNLPMMAEPTVSVLLCTKRSDYIPFALAQIARQRHVDLEVILLLHGTPSANPHVKEALNGFPWPISVIEVPEDVIFGEALNRGSEAASGKYIAKWDDDDWYGPEFLADLLMAASYSGADLVGCVHQFIYLEQINLTVFRPSGEPERYSKHVTGNSLVIDRHTFNELGRFRPLARQEDRGLLLAVDSAGGRTYRSHGFGSVIHRRPAGHTWNQPITHFLRNTARQWPGFRPSELLEVDDLRNRLANMKGPVPYDV